MKKFVLFIMLAVLLMAAGSVLADQDAYDCYCNIDQYGCWVTNEDRGKDYIMFWSESARAYFMGPDSNAVITDFCAECGGKMGMSGAPVSRMDQMISEILAAWDKNFREMYSHFSDEDKDLFGTPEENYQINADYLNSKKENNEIVIIENIYKLLFK